MLFLALLIMFSNVGGPAGRTLHVAPDGDDQNPGTVERPLATPARAIAKAAPGDTIYLRQGRYGITRFLWIDKDGLTLASHPGEVASIYGGVEDQPNSPTSVIIIVANNVSLRDLEIEGGSHYGVKVDVDRNPSTSGVSIIGCRIRNTGRDGIKTLNADNLLIENCVIGPTGVRDRSNAEGIDVIGSRGVTIRGCRIRDTATNGIYLKGGTRDGLVERNLVERTGHSGILLGQDTDLEYMRDGARHEAINCVARNNIVVETGAAGLGTYSGSEIRFENNTLYDVAGTYQAGLWIVTNTRDVPSRLVAFKNNIVVIKSGRPVVFTLDLEDALASDSNLFHCESGDCQFRSEVRSLNYYQVRNLEQWQRDKRADLRSTIADPMLEPSEMYRPRRGSPAIDRGETLTSLTGDFQGSARPRGAAYDIGAHEQTEMRGLADQR